MQKRGKNINLFLMDGSPSGIIKCTLVNWTGIAYKIPRNALDKCKGIEELKQSGVYILFGTSDETGEGVAYIGQAGARKNGEGTLNRLQEHKRNPDKDYWTEAIVFTTSNNFLGPTEISYLENRFCNLAIEANRYAVKNGNEPTPGNVTDEKKCELEEFIDYADLVMGALGHKLFEPLVRIPERKEVVQEEQLSESETLYLKQNSRHGDSPIEAIGMQTSDGFVVLAGSTISSTEGSIRETVKNIRSKAMFDEGGKLAENILFSSPSYAAQFVTGRSTNGPLAWKNKDGKTLADLEADS